ncbi:MAG: nitroreductase family protein [Treponema sp.]|jgi:nitroreductase|nr:nitroreductase family protein [Treponema sp.]
MKKSSIPVFIFFTLLFAIPGFTPAGSGLLPGLDAQEVNQGAYNNIINHYGARNNYTAGNISRSDIDKIVTAGIRAPSAGNRQPWHFTVVQDQALAKRIISSLTDGNVLIIISASGDGKTNGPAILDCALAAESIYLAAQALGYGSRIYTGPMETVNGLKTELGFPNGHSAVALVRVGKVQPVDAASAASARKSLREVVTYK